jgi:WD40 repeat protein/energy-coupling factor transporter ATP-binding protein EcfA2
MSIPAQPYPYPGLRPFRIDDSVFFFGRDQQVDQLLEKLSRFRLVAVVGASGCGKSSLVLAGLIPALGEGRVIQAGSRWKVASMRPGDRPLGGLAHALLRDGIVDSGWSDPSQAAAYLEVTLRRGPRGLIEALRPSPLAPDENLLLLVDQFEEIFRIRATDDRDEAGAFVALLLATVQQVVFSIYVVLTMRSEFLGDCARFPGLPEALNESQFLTPRLSRDQRWEAIEGPAVVGGGRVEPALIAHLLNDMGTNPDQLPLMQHALMWLWARATAGSDGAGIVLTQENYREIGGLAQALSRHADEAYGKLTGPQQAIAAVLFRVLSERTEGQLVTRRPTRLATVAAIARVPPAGVAEVVEAFRGPDLNFLTPPVPEPLGLETVLDIAHESLIRQWGRLQRWVEDEAKSAETYRRLEESARLWRAGQTGMLVPPELDYALMWRREQGPSLPWAARYGGDFDLTMQFLDASQQSRLRAEAAAEAARRRVQRLKLARNLASAAVLGLIVASGLLMWAVWERSKRYRVLVEAARFQTDADAARKDAARNIARAEAIKEQSEEQLAYARSGLLRAFAAKTRRSHPQHGLLLAVEAINTLEQAGLPPNPENKKTLRLALATLGGRALGRHEKMIGPLAISPDGRWLATGSLDTTARLWDLTAADPAATSVVLRAHRGPVTGVGFSRNNRWLASISRGDPVCLWDLAALGPSPRPIALRGHEAERTFAEFDPTGRWLLTISLDATARLWDLSAREPAAEPVALLVGANNGPEIGRAFSPDGRWLAIVKDDATTTLWGLTASGPVLRHLIPSGSPAKFLGVGFSPDSRRLVVSQADATARIWNLASPGSAATVVDLHDPGENARAVGRDATGRWVLTESPGKGQGPTSTVRQGVVARLWDLLAPGPDARSIRLGGYRGPSDRTIHISPDERWLVVRGSNRDAGLWDLSNRRGGPSVPIHVLSGHEGLFSQVDFSPDSRQMVTCGTDNTALVWALSTPDLPSVILRGHDGPVSSTAITPDGRSLITASADASIRQWTLAPPNPRAHPTVVKGMTGEGLAFRPNGRWLTVACLDGIARLWDLSAADPAAGAIPLHVPEAVTAVVLSEDGRWLVTSGPAGAAHLWDLTAPDPSSRSVALSGQGGVIDGIVASWDGRWLAGVSGDADESQPTNHRVVRLWDLAAPGTEPQTIPLDGEPWGLRITADGHWLVTQAGGMIHLRDLKTPRPTTRPVLLPSDKVRSVVRFFTGREGRWLITVGGDGTAQLWDLSAPDPPAAGPITLPGERGSFDFDLIGPDGRWLAVVDEDRARLWDLRAPDPAVGPIHLPGAAGPIGSAAFFRSNNSRWLATILRDNQLHLWDLMTSDPAASHIALPGDGGPVETAGFSSDDHWLITGGDDTVRLWDLTAPRPADTLTISLGERSSVDFADVITRPDGPWLVTADENGTSYIWAPRAKGPGVEPVVLPIFGSPLTAVVINADGRRVTTMDEVPTATFWEIPEDGLMEAARRAVGRNLSHAEWTEFFPGQPYRETFPNLPVPPDTIGPTPKRPAPDPSTIPPSGPRSASSGLGP